MQFIYVFLDVTNFADFWSFLIILEVTKNQNLSQSLENVTLETPLAGGVTLTPQPFQGLVIMPMITLYMPLVII